MERIRLCFVLLFGNNRPVGESVNDTDLFRSEHINDLVKQRGAKQISVNEECLHGIAGCWVVAFGVPH